MNQREVCMETKGNYIIKNAIHDTKSLHMELHF